MHRSMQPRYPQEYTPAPRGSGAPVAVGKGGHVPLWMVGDLGGLGEVGWIFNSDILDFFCSQLVFFFSSQHRIKKKYANFCFPSFSRSRSCPAFSTVCSQITPLAANAPTKPGINQLHDSVRKKGRKVMKPFLRRLAVPKRLLFRKKLIKGASPVLHRFDYLEAMTHKFCLIAFVRHVMVFQQKLCQPQLMTKLIRYSLNFVCHHSVVTST